MKQRYQDHMKNIAPSEQFSQQLERRMTDELYRIRRQKKRTPVRALSFAAAALVLVAGLTALLTRSPETDRIAPLQSVEATASPTESLQPAELQTVEPFLPDQRTMEGLPEEYYLVGYPSKESFPVYDQVYEEYYSQIDALTPMAEVQSGDLLCRISSAVTDDSQALNGRLEWCSVVWWDGGAGQLRSGWLPDPAKITKATALIRSSVETVELSGRVCAKDAELHAGHDISSPVLSLLKADRLVYIYARCGDWLLVSTEPMTVYNGFETDQATGWLAIGDVVAAQWQEDAQIPFQ